MYEYDVAFSFAGEDRQYVDEVADVVKELGLKVFYDKYEQEILWGKNLYLHLDEIYQKKAEFCVMFISRFYKEKLWTNHERESAQARAFLQKEEYILPARFDSTEIPGVRSTTGYINLREMNPSAFALLIAKKIKPNIPVNDMLTYLKSQFKGYEIDIKGNMVSFYNSDEEYYGEFPLGVLLEMYKSNSLDELFILPAIIPW